MGPPQQAHDPASDEQHDQDEQGPEHHLPVLGEMRSRFLAEKEARSMQNLGAQSIDCFYVHNPEQQLAALAPAELTKRLRAAFELLESKLHPPPVRADFLTPWLCTS